MNLPFVSRAMHQEVVEVLYRGIESERENAKMLRNELVDLRAKYHELRMSGANPVEAKPTLVPRVVDDVTQAINLKSRGDPRLRASMMAQATRDRAAKIPDHEIVDRINRGNTDDSLEGFAGSVA